MDRQLLTPTRRRPRGFTLIELIIVVAIMAILLTLAVSQASGGMEGMKMRQALETTRTAMEHARQVAITTNQSVMFRFYEMTDEFGTPAWRTMEFGLARAVTDPSDPEYSPPGASYEPVFQRMGSLERLPAGIHIHPSSTYSTLVSDDTALLRGTDTSPEDGRARKYVAFVYQPDGRCALPADKSWTITLVKEKDTSASGLPANYATIQLDPRTARVRTYRP